MIKIMGTNYFVEIDACEHCGKSNEDIHLGKDAAGWKFMFQYNGGQYYKNIEAMREWTADKKITDEYNEHISYDEFWHMIERKQEGKDHVNEYGGQHDFHLSEYTFTDCEFC